MDRFTIIAKNKIINLPKISGVYCFKKNKELIYIGKAINIRDRVKNHFQQPSYRDDLFIDKVDRIGYFETGSEIEALVLEASLIKKYQPKFNVVWRDDKNYFYVAVAQNDQKIPYVFITHQKSLQKTEYVGPFVEGTALKKTLRFLRRAFPYYTVKKHPKTKCMYCHLGLCPGPVRNSPPIGPPGAQSAGAISNGAGPYLNLPEYRKNIKKLILILKGKRSAVLSSLKKEMSRLLKEKKFEEAAKVRDEISNLQQVMSHASVIEPKASKKILGNDWQKTQTILRGLIGIDKKITRIECYDVSNMQGKFATGSMIVFIDGKPDKNQYRKFHIRSEGRPNDIAMLKEIIERRLSHKEWDYPETMLIDGGIAQLNIAISVKNHPAVRPGAPSDDGAKSKSIKVLSLAKRNKDLYIEGKDGSIPLRSLPREIYNLILQLDDEAHRFAITYHKKLRKKSLLV